MPPRAAFAPRRRFGVLGLPVDAAGIRLARLRGPPMSANQYRAELEALAIALRGTSDGVAILDPLGRISFVNRALANGFGRAESELVGRLLEEFVSVPGGDPALGDVVAPVGARGRWSGTLRLLDGDATRGIWDVTLTPIGSLAPADGPL